jgi:hypothetical protein
MRRPESTVCDVVDCASSATRYYLDTTLTPAVQFGICELHYAELLGGGEPVVLDSGPGEARALVIR